MQGVSIAHTVRGSGRPVLLIHGWQGDHRYMQADVDALFEAAGGWRRIYLDLPGHGHTPAPVSRFAQIGFFIGGPPAGVRSVKCAVRD